MIKCPKVGAAPTVEKITESRFRWFGHVMKKTRRSSNQESKLGGSLVVRGKGSLRKIIDETVKKDLEVNNYL